MIPLRYLGRKARFELEGVRALARYPRQAEALQQQLARRFEVLSLELTNVCNANCVFCAYQLQQRPTGLMADDLFRKVVAEFVALGGGGVNLTPTVGDPLVDPKLGERIAFLRAEPAIAEIGMYSNLILLPRFGAAGLIDAGLSRLVVSMSGPGEAMYRRVYRSRMYAKVLANVIAFAEENNRRGRPVDFSVDMRVDRPLAEVMCFPDYARIAAVVGGAKVGVKYRYDNWAGKIRQEDLQGTMRLRRRPSLRRPRISPCSALYWSPMVYWDGRVGACACRDVDARKLIIGDATRQTLSEIWQGEPLAQLRREFLTPACPAICRGCTHYNNLSNYLRRDT